MILIVKLFDTADFPHNLYKEIDMLKFFVTDFSWIEGMNDTGSYYGLCFPEEAEVLSFCRRENAEVLARKISERREEWSTEEVRYHSSCIYAIDVPDNWNGEDIALWLFDAIERNEITPVS